MRRNAMATGRSVFTLLSRAFPRGFHAHPIELGGQLVGTADGGVMAIMGMNDFRRVAHVVGDQPDIHPGIELKRGIGVAQAVGNEWLADLVGSKAKHPAHG